MARLTVIVIALALAGLAATALASCGEDDARLLPGETAREINANLDAVKQLADEGDCVGAESAAQQVSEQVEDLDGVDQRLKRALSEGAARLNEVVAECEEGPTEAIAPAEEPTTEGAAEDGKEQRKQDREREKEVEKAAGEDEADKVESEPSLPPQANGEGKGPGNGKGSPGEEAEAEPEGGDPSGGVSPGSPVGEGG